MRFTLTAVVLVFAIPNLFILCSGLTCPSPDDISPCSCDQVNAILTCEGASYIDLTTLIDNIKSLNPNGGHVTKMKMINYTDEYVEITTFSPCNPADRYCWGPQVNITYTEIDFSNNKNLKYVIKEVTEDYTVRERLVTVEHVTFRNCSLIKNTDQYYGYFYNALKAIGPTLRTIDLSANHLEDIPSSSMFKEGYNWPELVTLNLSNNLLPGVGHEWFLQTPNVDMVDLSNNQIKNIWNNAFSMNTPFAEKANKVVTFDLTNNRLSERSTYYSTFITYLKRPARFILANNHFQALPSSPFYDLLLNPDNTIDMFDNKLFCDCTSNWLKIKSEIFNTQVLNYNCINYNGTSLFDVEDDICCQTNCCFNQQDNIDI